MHPDVALGMIFGRLLYAFHCGYFGQDVREHAARIEQFETAARAAFGENSHQFVADALR